MAATASPAPPMIKRGVAPLRAGQGTSFLLRRLHSLSGIVPIGAFLVEHFISNAFATRGPAAYAKQVEFLSSFPFVVGLELFGIWLPILYHALYGFYIWYRGESNLADYPWAGNWMYSSQRWTGTIRISASLGGCFLRGRHCLCFVALRLRTVALCCKVGHYDGRQGAPALRLCLLRDCSTVHRRGHGHGALVPRLAPAAHRYCRQSNRRHRDAVALSIRAATSDSIGEQWQLPELSS